MTTAFPARLIPTLVLLTAISLMSLSMFLPSMGIMAAEFDVGYEIMALSVSAYMAVTALLQLIIGPIADRYGRRVVLLASLLIFALASIGCAYAEDFSTFLTFRILQGSVIAGSVLSRAIVTDLAKPNQAASILSYIAMAMSIAPIISPTIGGMVAEIAGWRANFWLYTGLGVALLALVWLQLPETLSRSTEKSSSFAKSYLELLGNVDFWAYALVISFSIGAFFVFISGVPLVAADQLGLSQTQTGLGLGSITIGFLVGSFLSGKRVKTGSLNGMIILGRIVATIGISACFLILLGGHITPWIFFCGTVFIGLGNGLTLSSANTAVMFVRKDLSATASGLSGAFMLAIGAMFSAVTGILLEAHPTVVTLVGIMMILAITSLLIALWISLKARKQSLTGTSYDIL